MRIKIVDQHNKGGDARDSNSATLPRVKPSDDSAQDRTSVWAAASSKGPTNSARNSTSP